MSREIKFRTWDPESQSMLNYQDIKLFNCATVLSHPNLMQYTGLKDETGADIWEGDIGKIGNATYRVCWNEAGAFFDLAWSGSTDMDTDFLLSDAVYTMPGFKVIGNAHENPELLESV